MFGRSVGGEDVASSISKRFHGGVDSRLKHARAKVRRLLSVGLSMGGLSLGSLLAGGLLAGSALADTIISSAVPTVQNGGTFVNSAPSLIVTHATNNPQLTLTNGAVTSNVEAVLVAEGFNHEGRLRIEGGSTLTVSGTGAISPSYGALSASRGAGYIGVNSNSTGIVVVTGASGANASTWTNTSGLNVGLFGHGELEISAGGKVSSGGSVLGKELNSTGKVLITGADALAGASTWTSTGSITVGDYGQADFDVTAGGKLSSTGAIIGYRNTSAMSKITISGGDATYGASTWTSTGNMNIGWSRGTLEISAGGKVTGTSATIGVSSVGQGKVLVTGTDATYGDSSWTNTGAITIGFSGQAELEIAAGGKVSNSISYIGGGSSATGTVLVTGTGSTWTNSGDVYVGGYDLGAGGSGLLNVSTGGKVISNAGAGNITVWSTGTLGGNGTVEANVINHGDLKPGNSPGILSVTGNYTQNSTGSLDIELGGLTVGTQYDRLAVTGTAALDGALSVNLVNSFDLDAGQSFTILTASSVSGEFAGLADGAIVGTFGGYHLVINYGLNNVVLSSQAVPEPSSIALGLLGLVGIAGMSFRRRRKA